MWLAIASFLGSAIVPLAIKVFAALGIGFATYTGVDFIISQAEAEIFANYNGLPADLYQVLNLMGFHTGLKIMFAGWAAYISVKAASGTITRLAMGR